MASTYVAVIALSLLSVITAVAGVALALRIGENRKGIAAGAMIFVSLHELAPLARKYENLPLLAVGISTGGVIYLLLEAII